MSRYLRRAKTFRRRISALHDHECHSTSKRADFDHRLAQLATLSRGWLCTEGRFLARPLLEGKHIMCGSSD